MSERIEYLKKYHKDVTIINNDISSIKDLPEVWVDMLNQHSIEKKIEKLIQHWKSIIWPQLSNTILYFEKNLINVELIKYKNRYSLLYSINSENGKVLYYEGVNPNKNEYGKLAGKFNEFPEAVRKFYNSLHDGFFIMPVKVWDWYLFKVLLILMMMNGESLKN